MGICEGRVAIVTGAGNGLGKAYALGLAAEGAKVVVNDLGVGTHGEDGATKGAAELVVEEIRAAGGEAVADTGDVADWDAGKRMVDLAVSTFGRLDAVVNNAGFVRDRMFVSCTPEEWDAVTRVHLRGHFCTSRHAVDYWRAQQKAGNPIDARIINTTSGAGLQGSVGQSAYSAAKAGIATLTLVQAAELARYGITANALAPNARTRMTATAFDMSVAEGEFDVFAPENMAPLVAYLVSELSKKVTGQVFELKGGNIFLSQGWTDSPNFDKGARFTAAELAPVVEKLVAEREPAKPVYGNGRMTGLTEDQIFIRDSARDFLRDQADFDRLRKAVDGAGWDRDLWSSFAGELGFAGIGISEANGGAGLGPVELSLIAEELGRTLAPIPWFETAVLAVTAISEAGSEAQQAALLGPIARGETIATLAMRDAAGRPLPDGVGPVLTKDGDGWRLSGRAHFVPFGEAADLVVVAARQAGTSGWDGISLVAVPAFVLMREALTSFDLTRPLAHVDLDLTVDADAILGEAGAAGPALRRTLAIASGILASEQVGGMQRTLDETVDYSKQRVQFGRLIGSFQAMKHRMADMKLWLEAARSAAAMAADAIARNADDMETLCASARAYCSDAYLRTTADGIQLHGGIGFTWEHHAHLFFKRARGTASLLDSPAHHRELVARAIIDTDQAA